MDPIHNATPSFVTADVGGVLVWYGWRFARANATHESLAPQGFVAFVAFVAFYLDSFSLYFP
jgi:hypothetical protein